MYQIIIIAILLYLLSTNNKTEGIQFSAAYMRPFYKKHKIKIDSEHKLLTKGGKTICYKKQFNTESSRKLSNNKIKTKNVLIKNNIPTPKYYKWDVDMSFDKNCDIISTLNFPIVIKPNSSMQGSDVYANIDNIQLARKLLKNLLKKTDNILIEEFVQGNVYRVFVFNNKIIGVYHIQNPCVIGDGKHTVKYLINTLINDAKNPMNSNQINYVYIHKQGYEMSDILEKNKKLIVSNVANGSIGSEPIDIKISDIHPHNIELFLNINKILGLNSNGIDYITHDMAIPYYEYGHVLETNPCPGINTHYKSNPKSIDKLVKLLKFS